MDRTPYPLEGRVDPHLYQFEAQLWEGEGFEAEGVTFRRWMDAVEFLS